MSSDFLANQIRVNKIIASGSTGASAKLLVYPENASSNTVGGINSSIFNTSLIGSDVFLFVSGAINSINTSTNGASVFGGDVHISGNLKIAGTVINSSNIPSSSIAFAGSSSALSGSATFFYNSNTNTVSLSGSNGQGRLLIGTDSTSFPVSSGIALRHGSRISGKTATFSGFQDIITWDAVNGVNNSILVGYGSAPIILMLGSAGFFALSGTNAVISSTKNQITGAAEFLNGFSGSHTKLVDGTSYIIGISGVNVSSASNGSITLSSTVPTDWTSIYEVDFSTLSTQNVNASTTASFAGKQWFVENGANSDWIGVSSSVNGLLLDPNATSTDFFNGNRTCPLIGIKLNTLISDFDFEKYDVRYYLRFGIFGSDANFETLKGVYERYPVVGSNAENQGWGRGFDNLSGGGSGWQWFTTVANTTTIGYSTQRISDNTVMHSLSEWRKSRIWSASGSSGLPSNNTNMLARAETTLGIATTLFKYGNDNPMSGSDVAITFATPPSNTNNSFYAVLYNFRVEYKIR